MSDSVWQMHKVHVGHWFSTRDERDLQRTFGNVGRHFWLSDLEQWMLPASSGWKLGMLFNIVQCRTVLQQRLTSPKCQQHQGQPS